MDSNMLAKLMAKKKGEALDPEYKKAKMGVLQDLHGEMGKMMGNDLHGLKKVTVASDDTSGLKEGLDKAKELLAGKAPEGSDAEEASESPEEEKAEDAMADMGSDDDSEEKDPEDMSPEEIEAKIQELKEALTKKLMK
jgi:hypothetical protein